MKKLMASALLVILASYVSAQSLNPERVNKIKNSTVQIFIGGAPTGSGFFISDEGDILTCFHVIQPALQEISGTISQKYQIIVETRSKERMEMLVNWDIVGKSVDSAISYDYCVLSPTIKGNKLPFLKTGHFKSALEGQQVYTCGYPIGIPYQFISSGIISTKYHNTQVSFSIFGVSLKSTIGRNEALSDLSMTRGNSGGPILKIGKSVDEDEVIGIADFIVTPAARLTDSLISKINMGKSSVEIGGIDPNLIFSQIIEVVQSFSIGVSGFVSIEYFQKKYNSYKATSQKKP